MTRAAFRSLLVAILVLHGGAGCALAPPGEPPLEQDAAYARTPGDTLRYHGISTSYHESDLGAMQRSGRTRTVREARTAVAFTGGDTARAWIESYHIQTSAEVGGTQNAGPEVTMLPFGLTLGALGDEETLSTPDFPQYWSGLKSYFTNFFPRLPGGPLHLGRTWGDTIITDLSTEHFRGAQTRIIRYRVTGQERIRGVPVVVVAFDSYLEGRLDQRNPPDPITMPFIRPIVEKTEVEEHGHIYFAPRTGRLVRRTRQGVERRASSSPVNVEGMTYTTEYSSTLELLPDRRR
ncbi:MAG TPA: hypothetical protein VEQ60_31700 [Longimicrobium sp.]|nr:hypothetical protein [Longimicrobium sp.]